MEIISLLILIIIVTVPTTVNCSFNFNQPDDRIISPIHFKCGAKCFNTAFNYEFQNTTTNNKKDETSKTNVEIFLNSREIGCQGQNISILFYIQCTTRYICDKSIDCMANGTTCDYYRITKKSTILQENCPPGPLPSCTIVLSDLRSAGIVGCANAGGTPTSDSAALAGSKDFIFVSAETGDWILASAATKMDIITMRVKQGKKLWRQYSEPEEGNELVFYENEHAQFVCYLSQHLCDGDTLEMFWVGQNGTKIFLDDNSIKKTNRGGPGQLVAIGKVEVTLDMAYFGCTAQIYDSDNNWIEDTFEFKVLESSRPMIQNLESEITLNSGDTNSTINCTAWGIPAPKINWIFDKSLSESSQLVIDDQAKLSENQSESRIRFPLSYEGVEGTYTCVASSVLGNDSFEFHVNVEQKEEAPQDGGSTVQNFFLYGLIIFFGLLLTLLTTIFVFYWRKSVNDPNRVRTLTSEEIKAFQYDRAKYEIPLDKIQFETDSKPLGKGNFGSVLPAIFDGQDVAVKKTNPGTTSVLYFKSFLVEIKVLAYVAQSEPENVVKFLGACTSNLAQGIILIVMERAVDNLRSYVLKFRDSFIKIMEPPPSQPPVNIHSDDGLNSQEELRKRIWEETSSLLLRWLSWCKQIANGMCHLEEKKIFHGDMALRNVLLFPDDVVKISDFGHSRALCQCGTYFKKSKMPIAWQHMAVESHVLNVFTTKSDVWSFGVTVWEMFTLGEIPFVEWEGQQGFSKHLALGGRLMRPKYASDDVYAIIKTCWNVNPEDRPSFQDLYNQFQNVILTTPKNFDDGRDDMVIPNLSSVVSRSRKITNPSTSSVVSSNDDDDDDEEEEDDDDDTMTTISQKSDPEILEKKSDTQSNTTMDPVFEVKLTKCGVGDGVVQVPRGYVTIAPDGGHPRLHNPLSSPKDLGQRKLF